MSWQALVRQYFVDYSRTEGKGYAPLYERLAPLIAHDEQLLGLLEAAPPMQRRPVLMFAATHALIMRHPDQAIARWYPSIDGPLARSPDEAGLFPAFKSFCLAHAAELHQLFRERRTQTNEVGRSAFLLPIFSAIGHRTGQPLYLLEVGASAGLNLLFDRYACHYSSGEVLGDRDSTVQIQCELRGTIAPPLDRPMPVIAGRIGLDIAPIHAGDPVESQWLRACVFADNTERAGRLAAALALARASPPELVTGDALEKLPGLIAAAPRDARLCIFHTWVITYLPRERRTAFAELLRQASHQRTLTWVAGENAQAIPGLDTRNMPVDLNDSSASPTVLTVTDWASGVPAMSVVGRSHPHGAWLEWLDPAGA